MAILKFKKLIEDLETGSRQVVTVIGKATSSGYAGTSYMATSSGNTGTAYVAHRASSGTAKLAGTHADYATGAQGF